EAAVGEDQTLVDGIAHRGIRGTTHTLERHVGGDGLVAADGRLLPPLSQEGSTVAYRPSPPPRRTGQPETADTASGVATIDPAQVFVPLRLECSTTLLPVDLHGHVHARPLHPRGEASRHGVNHLNRSHADRSGFEKHPVIPRQLLPVRNRSDHLGFGHADYVRRLEDRIRQGGIIDADLIPNAALPAGFCENAVCHMAPALSYYWFRSRT